MLKRIEGYWMTISAPSAGFLQEFTLDPLPPGTNVYAIAGSTVDFNGSGAQTIPAFAYNNLTSSSTGGRTLASSGNVRVAGVFTPGTNAYTIAGSTVEYNGSSAQALPSTFPTYNNLTLNNAAGTTGFAGLTPASFTVTTSVGIVASRGSRN